jgi:hypothetical protein
MTVEPSKAALRSLQPRAADVGRLLPDADRSMAADSARSTSDRVRPVSASRSHPCTPFEGRLYFRQTNFTQTNLRQPPAKEALKPKYLLDVEL